MTQAFIFDFDGTLVDSEQAIYQCFQSITKQLAPNRVEYAKNILIGPPLRDTASEILGPEHQDSLDEFVQLFIEMHDEQVIQHTQPYPDVIEVLKQLHTQNIPMAVATNKRLAPTQKLMDYFGWNDYFQFIECSDSQSEMRNKDAMIQDIVNQNPSFQGSYFIGDTVNDGLSANLNQLPFIKACYGYGRNQDWS
ncbi:MAG: HAD family hydrolase, partial [Methylophilaceae bacterium]